MFHANRCCLSRFSVEAADEVQHTEHVPDRGGGQRRTLPLPSFGCRTSGPGRRHADGQLDRYGSFPAGRGRQQGTGGRAEVTKRGSGTFAVASGSGVLSRRRRVRLLRPADRSDQLCTGERTALAQVLPEPGPLRLRVSVTAVTKL